MKLNKIDRVCNAFLIKSQLTRIQIVNFSCCGDSYVDDLLSKGIIKKIDDDLFEYNDYRTMAYYGKKLFSNGQREKAIQCYIRCLEIDSTNFRINYEMFIEYILIGDFEKAFFCFDKIFSKAQESQKSDLNYYLLLLSKMTVLPCKYQEYVKKLKLKDILIPQNRINYTNVEEQNKIRINIFNNKTKFALKQLRDIISSYGSTPTRIDYVNRVLIASVLDKKAEFLDTIVSYIKLDDYASLIKLLSDKQKQCSLSTSELIILELTIRLLIIKEYGISFERIPTYSSNLLDFINHNDFEGALFLAKGYSLKGNQDSKENPIFLLLDKISTFSSEIEYNKEYGL